MKIKTLLLVVALSGCAAGHQDFIDLRNDLYVGKVVMKDKAPYKYSDSGKFVRGDYVISGQGLTKIDTDGNGNLIYHISVQEILPNTRTEKEWVGKCLIYYVVDSSTYLVKDWGFDKGGNPLSCRTFT
jgi:hypothetical protein